MTQFYPANHSTCPVCRSREVHSSRSHGFMERIVLYLLRIHSFWCNDCFSRFYLFFPQSELCPQESRDGNFPVLNGPNARY